MSNIKFIEKGYSVKWITFSDKAETCKVISEEGGFPSSLHIICQIIDGTRDLIRLGLIKDALHNVGVQEVKLSLPYVPQARADRVFEYGNPLPIKLFCDILNTFEYTKVYISDPHSDVTSALINNVEVIPQQDIVRCHLPQIKEMLGENFRLVAPDVGSSKKIFDVMMKLGHTDFIQAVKIRDVTTGNIVKCDLTTNEVSGNILIVDDICDGGASFKYLSSKLKEKGASKVGLYVTHGIFGQKLDGLQNIDYIVVDNIVGEYITQEDIRSFNG